MEDKKRKKKGDPPDTLLPIIMEHRTGGRVYPYTWDPAVLEFYLNTKTDHVLVMLGTFIYFL